ncbi:acetyltransferase [Serinibacter arcticus]|uniref:Acetyltransferase n=1 Tax=Serinibacter arcticus TaxID=1655435 RepID=A0A2U1ZR23_9MICO|nr:acyltransferase family protein [Serinibacter arcticus]PWD49391.1 acetyltransferase [Serinibacter arcticus]
MTVTLGRGPARATASAQASARPPAPRVEAPSSRPLPHLRGLDGVRALAVAAVVAYHAGATWLPGGFLGVDVFFVLSGFLITALLAHEVRETGGFRIGTFYRRRIARLVPALWTMIAAVALAGLVWREQLDALRGSIVAGLTSTSNWWMIAADESYFSSGGRPPLLRHLWSLALEAQFYLLAPLLAWVLLRRGRRYLGRIALGLAIASAALMAVWAVRGEMPIPFDPSRLYFGTDTHLAGLMIGVVLACVWQPWRTWPGTAAWLRGSDATPRWRSGLVADLAGVVGLMLAVVVMATQGELSPSLYRGGFLSFSVMAALLVAAAAHPGSLLGRGLALPPLAWLGTRSYGIYLWHWPVFAFTRPGLDVPGPDWLVQTLRIALVLGIAELSFRYVETPARRGGLQRWFAGLREPGRPGRLLVASGAATAVLALGAAVALVPGTSSDAELGARSVAEEAATPASARATDPVPDDPTPEAPAPLAPAAAPVPPPAPAAATTPAPAPTPAEELGTVSAVGDSVLAMAAPDLGALGVGVDAVKSRQFREMADLVLTARDSGTLGHTVVVHGGTNGPIAEADLRRLLDGTADRRVFLVTIKAPVAWEGMNNELLARVVPEYPHAGLIDWAGAATAHPDWLYSDTIHPREGEGSAAMANLVWTTIQPGWTG